MPEDFLKTINVVKDSLTDLQIKEILNCEGAKSANKKLLQFLTEKMSCGEDLLKLCAQLEKISISSELNRVITEIKSSMYIHNENIL